MVTAFFSWWYGAGWKLVAGHFQSRTAYLADHLSMNLLSRTLTWPWRRIISYEQGNLNDQLRAMVDNAVSRTIGFVIRATVLVAGLVLIMVVIALTTVEVIVWPLLPVAPLVLLVVGIIT